MPSCINFDDVLFPCTRMILNNIKFWWKTHYCGFCSLPFTSTPLHPYTSCHYIIIYCMHSTCRPALCRGTTLLGRPTTAFIHAFHTLGNWGQKRDCYINHMLRALSVHTVHPPHNSQGHGEFSLHRSVGVSRHSWRNSTLRLGKQLRYGCFQSAGWSALNASGTDLPHIRSPRGLPDRSDRFKRILSHLSRRW